jgi:uncharacterized lipoprotein YmbA
MHPYSILIVTVALLLPTLVGCGSSSPTRLYVLSADAEKSGTASGIAIGLGPLTLPKYLDRPQIVTRIASNSLSQGDFDQWGGDLNDNITRVLAINLANLLGTDRVSLYPWRDPAAVGYQITLDITQFEQDANGGAALDVFWSLIDPSSGKILLMRRSTYQENGAPGASGGSGDTGRAEAHGAAAAAMSRDLAALSRDIAAAIRQQRAS